MKQVIRHVHLMDFGSELARAKLAGEGMNIVSYCNICGKHRSQGKHTRCSKIRKQRGF